jgi:hypothetical protein
MNDAIQVFEGDGEMPEGASSPWSPTDAQQIRILMAKVKVLEADHGMRIAQCEERVGTLIGKVEALEGKASDTISRDIVKMLKELGDLLRGAHDAMEKGEQDYETVQNGGYVVPEAWPWQSPPSKKKLAGREALVVYLMKHFKDSSYSLGWKIRDICNRMGIY